LGVLKEFIQNADDAEADEIVFRIDEQQYETASLPQSMQWLHQTSALLIYNNKSFSDSDIEGIQNIGESGKSDSIGKTGRFGLGFNACYNVTDVPCFFTRDELHFFDPHYQTVPGSSVESPGRSFGVEELIHEGWPLLDGLSSLIGNDNGFEGTVFRLPFRTTDQAITSEIKRDAFTVADALDAVDELQKVGSAILLFLKHVRRLTVERRSQNGSLVTLLCMQANNPEEIASSRSKVNDLLSSADAERILTHLTDEGDTFSSCIHEYSVEVNETKCTETWRIVDGFFTDRNHEVIDACREMIQNQEKALPYAGAAWRLGSDARPEGSLFCFLPVPAQTSLPVQVNGYFDLDDSRQNMFLDRSAHGTARLRVKWNRTLLETSVSLAYIQLLEDLRFDLGSNNVELYYDAFPAAVDSEASWEGWLTSSFYEFASIAPLFRCSGDITWHKVSATRSLPVNLTSLGNELIAEGFLPIPDPAIPPRIQQGFRLNDIETPELTPCDLRNQLRVDCDVDCSVANAPRACLRKREHVRQIVRFCLSDDPKNGIHGLPLVIDCRGHLRTAGLTDRPLYISEISHDLDVFWDHPEWFVDPDYAQEGGFLNAGDVGLADMDSDVFVRELADYVTALVGEGEPKLNRSGAGALTDAWLKAVFYRLLESDRDGFGSDLNEIPLVPNQSEVLYPMGSSSTPLLFRGSIELKRALTDLSVPLVSGVSKELQTLLGKVSEDQDCIWWVTPRDLVDTLADECSEVLDDFDSFTDMHQALLDYLSKDASLGKLKELSESQEKLRSLRLFPTAKGRLISLSEAAYVPQDFTFPSVDFEVDLLNVGPLHSWRQLYLLLGAPELSRSRLIQEVLLPGFRNLDEDERIKASAWLRDNLSIAQSESEEDSSQSLFEEVRTAPIIMCEDGELRAPTRVYRPESKLARAVLGDRASFPAMEGAYAHGRERWLEFFRQLNMPEEPLLSDVIDYVLSLVTKESGEDNAQRLQSVYEFIKGRVETEIQNPDDVSDELENVLGELADIPWIPLRQNPGNFLCFKHPDEKYARPRDVYFPRVGQLVASQACITVLRTEPDKRARKTIGFPVKPPVELVVNHFSEVLHACSTTETVPENSVLVRALGQIYRFFGGESPREAGEFDEDIEELESEGKVDLRSVFSEVPCIWDQEEGRFWCPNHVFTDSVRYMEPWRRTIRSTEDAVERGYAVLGRRLEPTVDDWKQVLAEVAESRTSPMDHTTSGVIRDVVRRIVEELSKEGANDGEVLVPTRDGRMLEAEMVFLADAPWYEPMLDSWGIPILAPSLSGLLGIQRVLAIPSLADSVEQQLTEFPVDSDHEDECQECLRLENILVSSEFVLGLQRLLRHEGHEVSKDALSYLRDVQIRCVKAIRTCLFLQTDGIERLLGDAEADSYWDQEALQAMLVDTRRRYYCDDLAELLNRTFVTRSLQNLSPLVHMLRCKPGEISEVLDDLKVRKYTFEPEARPDDEEEVTPQVFPSEDGEPEEMPEIVESDVVEVPPSEDGEHEEKNDAEESSGEGNDSPPRHDSTATRPDRDDSGGPDLRQTTKRSEGSEERGVPGDARTTGSAKQGKKSDIEKSETAAGRVDASGYSTTTSQGSTPQRRLVSYVSQGDRAESSKDTSPGEVNRRQHISDASVKIVIDHEQVKGREARSMAHPNAGYDVVSEGKDGTRYIEVKGTEVAWGERGVAMTATQFFYAKENPNRDHWLYVVENVFSKTPLIHEIQNPSEKVDRFVFDGGWMQAAESVQGAGVEMPIPVPGDEVLEDGEVVGIVESIVESGKFPLVRYRGLDGTSHRKLLADLMTRSKES
jgi:sacsin